MDMKFTLLFSSIYMNIQDLNKKLESIFNSYYNKKYTNKFSTGVIDLDYSINPVVFKIYDINNKKYFRLYTLFNNALSKKHIYYGSLIDCIYDFNDEMLKRFYSFQKISILKKLLMRLKVQFILKLNNY